MATQQSSFTRPHLAGAVAPPIKPIPAPAARPQSRVVKAPADRLINKMG